MSRRRAWLLLALGLAAACVRDDGFRCAGNAQCGGGGVCEPTGFCSFFDDECAAQRRYGGYAGALSNSCVTPPDLQAPTGDAGDGGGDGGSRCGDSVVDDGELCDDGPANSDDPRTSATCTTGCQLRAPCGSLTGAVAARINPANGHCYVAWPQTVNWATAERDCRGSGGTLATLTSSAENELVRGLAIGEHWIGMTSPPAPPAAAQNFQWVTGEARAFNGFAPGQPDNAGGVEECVSFDTATGWQDRPCGWPKTGELPPSPPQALPYVCENGCGNGVVEQGEECDPPGAACTPGCRTVRSCNSPSRVSPVTGHCYFLLDTTTTAKFSSARTLCRPFGAHLATLDEPAELQSALVALDQIVVPDGGAPTFAWIDLTEQGVAVDGGVGFAGQWVDTGEPFNSRRFHAYVDPDPDMVLLEGQDNCVVTSLHYDQFGTDDGWRDRSCNDRNLVLCERE